MDFERLERVWRSDANTLDAAAAAYLKEEIMDTLKRRRESFRTLTGLVGLALVLWTAKIAYDVVMQPFPFDPVREWGALLLVVAPWACLIAVTAGFRRHLRDHPNPYASVPATLRALIDENGTTRRRVRWLAWAMAAFIGLMALVLYQLVEVGKMSMSDVAQGSLMFGIVFAAVWALIATHYLCRLRPEAARLQRLAQSYDDGGES